MAVGMALVPGVSIAKDAIQQVQVMNGADAPVPVDVQAPVQVDTSTPLSVKESGPVTVTAEEPVPVSPAGPVQVTARKPLPVSQSVTPFQAHTAVEIQPNWGWDYGTIDVPDGFRMIVEQFSAWTSYGQDFTRAGITSGGSSLPALLIPAVGGTAADQVIFRQSKPGDLTVYAERTGFDNQYGLRVYVNVFGHLVPEESEADATATAADVVEVPAGKRAVLGAK